MAGISVADGRAVPGLVGRFGDIGSGDVRWRVLTVLACILGLYLRVPDRFRHLQFWAEDGPILFIQSVTGGARSLIEPYQGALYSFQRIAALISVSLPWEYVPAAFMAFTWTSFILVLVWCMSERIPAPPSARIVMALLVAYAPVKNETYLNLINAHWALCGLGLLLLLMSHAPTNARQRAFDYGMLVLLALTGPFVLIYLPIFILRPIAERDRHSTVLLVLALICGAVQLLQLYSRDYELMGGVLNPSVAQFLSVLTFRFLWMFIGYSALPFRTLPLIVGLVSTIAIMAVAIGLLRVTYKAGGLRWTFPILACGLVLFPTFVQYREMPEALINAARYFFIPIVTFLWAATLAATARPRVFGPVVAIAVIAFLSHPRWREYDMPDLGWRQSADCLRTDPDCIVAIHPTGFEFSVFAPRGNTIIPAAEIFARSRANAAVLKARRAPTN